MRGKVIHYDDTAGSGLISGDDGKRYPFNRGDLMGGARVASAGQDADFQVESDVAKSVFLQGGGSSDKSRIAAALLAFFLGAFGAHKFYLGRTTAGVIMLIAGTIGWLLILPGFAIAVIGFIEFIIYLVKSDTEFKRDYIDGQKSWF